MKSVYYEEFGKKISIEHLPDPVTPENGVVIHVKATGLCLSDWHGWMGNDPDITLPHVPGHELAGVIQAVGKGVNRWSVGDRVTLPFVCGCGICPQCISGNQQVCDDQFQPGFTHWGSFAELVAIDRADINLVRLPEELDYVAAATLGCRFVTSFRAIVDQAKASTGQWVAVYGCGGVGLSAIMIANALGANVIAIDIRDDKLELAREVGASITINATHIDDVAGGIIEGTNGGAHISLDALGSQETCYNSIASLRKHGKHVQVGLMTGDYRHPTIPMDRVIAHELQIIGSHGMQAYRYEDVFEIIRSGKLNPEKLVGKLISLEDVPQELACMDKFDGIGVTMIDKF